MYSDSSNKIVKLSPRGEIAIIDPDNGKLLSAGEINIKSACGSSQPARLYKVAFNANRNLFAFGFNDGSIQIVAYPDLRHVASRCIFSGSAGQKEYSNVVQGLLFSNDRLIVLSRMGDLASIDLEHFSIVNKISTGKESFSLHHQPNGPYFAIASHSSSIFRGHSQGCLEIAFSGNGRMLASAGLDGTARVWDTASTQPISLFSNHTGPLNEVRFSPDDKEVFTASEDGTVRIWDPLTGQPVQPPEDGHLLRPVASLSDNEWKYMRESLAKSPQEANELIQMSCRLLRNQPEYPTVASLCGNFLSDR
jgi:WD40 repeat protein